VGATLLDEVRTRLGIARLSDLTSSSGDAWSEAVWRIAESYAHWASDFKGPLRREPQTLRPAICPVTGMAPFDEARAAAYSLLIAHSVAVSITDTISYVGRFARLLILLEDLIDAELIVIVPEPTVSEGFFSERLRGAGVGLPQHSIADAPRDVQESVIKAALENAEVGIALDLCRMYPDAIDLACRTSGQVATLRRLTETADEMIRFRAASSQDQLHFFPDLLDQELPILNLPVSDLVKIRKDGLFEPWRMSLQRGLRIIAASKESDLINPRSAERQTLREVMEEGADNFRNQVGRSRTMRNSQVGLMGFGASCAAGALGSLGGPEIGAVVGGSSYLLTLLLSWFSARSSSGERAFRRLIFNLFNDTS
jgi:hypothetical protein